MRRRFAVALVVLSFPIGALSAQRVVVPPRTSRAPRPAEKPPQAPGIPDARLYSRYRMSRFSFEQYPMLTHVQATGLVLPGIASSENMFGNGTDIGFRIAPSLYATVAMTSAFLGAPMTFGSLDAGFRLKPWASRRFRPFADARVSHAYVVPAPGLVSVVPVVFLTRNIIGNITAGGGNGRLLGLGVETTIRRNLLLSSSLSSTHYAMTGRQLTGARSEWRYTADALRLGVGVRYNRGRWLDAR